MKKVLVIGSTVTDIIVKLSHLPVTGEDINIWGQKMSIGGCAFNVSQSIAYYAVPYLLFSPVGTGIYAQYVKNSLENLGVQRAGLEAEIPNGCCYCLVEDGGERTFICDHGAEYKYKKEWFDALDYSEFSCVYICGLEMEEDTGDIVIDFLEESKIPFYFSPGPRINAIQKYKMERIFSLNPILHVNKTEALSYTGANNMKDAAEKLQALTNNIIIVTDGDKGSNCLSKDDTVWYEVPSFKSTVVDTIGAGDAHIGTFIAQRQLGKSIVDSLKEANKMAARIVEQEGATLKNK